MSEMATTDGSDLHALDARSDSAISFRSLTRARYVVPVCLLLIISGLLVNLKLVRFTQFQGDSAIFFQLTENIAHRGAPISGIFANTQSYLDSQLLVAKASEIAKNPLAPPAQAERNMLKFHAYVILYPIALLARFIPAQALLLSLYVLSYTGVVFLAFFFARSRSVPIALALLFCLLMISHPAWSQALLFGQFFPDRLFVAAGFVFMWIVSRERSSRVQIIGFAILCALINERAALMAGAFLLVHTLLYWKFVSKDRLLRFGIAVGLLVTGFVLTKAVLVNGYYSSFMPTSVAQVLANFSNPAFDQKALVFGAVNAPFLILAFFEWRAAVLAIVLMLPNLLGYMGGAEKVGWTTHYSSYYLPAVYWAALMGCIAAFRKASVRKQPVIAYAGISVLLVALNLINPQSASGVQLTAANLTENFLVAFPVQAFTYLGSPGSQLLELSNSIQNAVPKHVVVSAPESMMPLLYHDRVVHYFPIGIDTADYAVVTITGQDHGQPVFGGAASYLGQSELRKINAVIVNRMKRDGYDFKTAKIFPALSVAIVKRKH